jgi:hypothetical protein
VAAQRHTARDQRAVRVGRGAPVLGIGGVEQHEAGDLRTVPLDEEPGDEPAEGVSDEDVGRRDVRAVQQLPQLAGDTSGRARERARIAPAEAGPIVDARPREPRHLGLHERPAERRGAERGVEHD